MEALNSRQSALRRVVGGASHAVDSSDMAFRAAGRLAMRQIQERAESTVLEPLMKVEITAPEEFQGAVVSGINKRKGTILNSENHLNDVIIEAEVPLSNMFGYSTDIRSSTQGKGEFSMEYLRHAPVMPGQLAEMTKDYQKERAAKAKK